jgi:hypothetical protein
MSLIPNDGRLLWAGTDATIPSGWLRDTSFDGKQLQGGGSGFTSPGNGGGASHDHVMPAHTHGGSSHSHSVTSSTYTQVGFATVNGSVLPTIWSPAAKQAHFHSRQSSVTATLAYLDSAAITLSTESHGAPSVQPVLIKPTGATSPQYIPSGTNLFTDEPTPQVGFAVDIAFSGYFVSIMTGGNDASTTGIYSDTHQHTTSGHSHAFPTHTHGSITGTAANPRQEITASSPSPPKSYITRSHHRWLLNSANAGIASIESPGSDAVANDPLYTRLLAIRNTDGDIEPPSGVVIMFVGDVGDIPDGWTLMDGTLGSLVSCIDRQVKCTSDSSEIGDTGGSNEHTHVMAHVHSMVTSHNHAIAVSYIGTTLYADAGFTPILNNAIHAHSWTVTSTTPPDSDNNNAVTDASDIRVDYRTILYIKKVPLSTEAVEYFDDTLLYIKGHMPYSGDVSLFVGGDTTSSGNVELYIGGRKTQEASGSLFISSFDETTGNTPLFATGYAESSSNVDLFVHGLSDASGQISLYISGPETVSGNVNLYTESFDTTVDNCSLFMYGGHDLWLFTLGGTWADSGVHLYLSGSGAVGSINHTVDTYLQGKDGTNSSIGLYLSGKDEINLSVNLYEYGFANESNNCSLFIYGGYDLWLFIEGISSVANSLNDTIDLYISGRDETNASVDLYVSGRDATNSSVDLYLYGKDTDDSSIDLYISGRNETNASTDLYILGNDATSLSIDLYLLGHNDVNSSEDFYLSGQDSVNTSVDLFVSGSITGSSWTQYSGSTALYLGGHGSISGERSLFVDGYVAFYNDISLSINGYLDASGNIDLFILSHEDSTYETDLYVRGNNNSSGSVDLFTNGSVAESGQVSLFINGSANITSSVDVYLQGYALFSGDVPLYINGHINASSDVDLFIPSIDTVVGNIALFIGGYGTNLSNISLYIIGHMFSSGNTPCVIGGLDSSSYDQTLFIEGSLAVSGGISLYIGGSVSTDRSVSLYVAGSGISFETNTMSLLINGLISRESVTCPTLDPTASVQISDRIINIYKNSIDALINQLGKNTTLIFQPQIVSCPNCSYDAQGKISTGVYNIGGPRPFARGRQCPYCKGAGTLKTESEQCIKCLVKWSPRDLENYGISIENTDNVVRLKTYITHMDDLMRADNAIVLRDSIGIAKLKTRRIIPPVPVGLRYDRYCISFWELI